MHAFLLHDDVPGAEEAEEQQDHCGGRIGNEDQCRMDAPADLDFLAAVFMESLNKDWHSDVSEDDPRKLETYHYQNEEVALLKC